MPLGTPAAAYVVTVDPVLKFARLVPPRDDPACSTYDEGGQPPEGGVQVNVTALPVDEAVNPVGGFGAAVQLEAVTVTTTSFEAALVPALF